MRAWFRDRGLEGVGVNFRDDGDTDAYAREKDIDFDIVLGGDALAAQADVTGTPTVFVLDGDDRVVLRTSTSEPDSPALRNAVESLMPPDTAGISGTASRRNSSATVLTTSRKTIPGLSAWGLQTGTGGRSDRLPARAVKVRTPS